MHYLKKAIGIILGICLLAVIGVILPTPEGMTPEAQKVMGIAACALSLWIFDVFPIGISSVCAMLLIPIMGVMKFDAALSQFMKPATFFVVATYAISCALAKTPLAARILRGMIKIAGTETNRLILALMAATALISTFMSNVPVTAMMMSVSLSILTAMNAKPGTSRLGKTLMIGIPFGAMCGGIATPAGSSVNVIAIGLLNVTTGSNITFLQWMLFGVPLAIVLVPVSWIIVVKTFKPETIPHEAIAQLVSPEEVPDKITKREWKGIIIILLTIAMWIAGSWIPMLDMTLVAAISMVLFFIPGVNVFTWEEFAESISWDAVFTVGSVMALGYAVVNTGLGAWIVSVLFANANLWPTVVLFLVVAFVTNFIHLVLPLAPAIVTILLPPVLILAQDAGYSVEAFTVIVSMMAGCVMLLPIDTVTVLTYSKKYYTIADLFKAGIFNSCIWSVAIALWVLFVSGLVL